MEDDRQTISMDYRVTGRCQYPVESGGTPYPDTTCSEPAPFAVYWIDEDGGMSGGEMQLCPKHFSVVCRNEGVRYHLDFECSAIFKEDKDE